VRTICVELLDQVLRWSHIVLFVAVAVWALRRWRRQSDEQSAWLAAAFGLLGLVLLVSRVAQLLFGEDESPLVLFRVLIALLVLFPYPLLRFLDSFEAVPSTLRRATLWAVLGQVAYALVGPVPAPGASNADSTAFVGFTLVVVATWLAVLPFVGYRFWRAGRHRPTLARRRLRLLGLASVTLSVALVLAAFGEDVARWVQLTTQVVVLVAAGLFVVAFVTPPILRRLWRQEEERKLHHAAIGLMSTTGVPEVASVLVPHLGGVISGRAVALVHQGELVDSEGLDEDEERAVLAGEDAGARRVELRDGALLVWTDGYAPFFGEDEQELLERAGLLADLALHRAGLLASEQEARRALQETNAELESFVYSASHDLKSPLIAMLSYIDILQREHLGVLGEEAAWYLERMASNGEYMESLIQDLLELSRVGRFQTEPERVELAPLVDELVAEVRGQHPTFEADVAPLPTVWMNRARARQLFANLLENAAKHAGGRPVRVAVRAETAHDDASVVSILDDGPGVPAEYRERVFGVFERLEVDDQTGTGIGLAICRKIVEAVGGRIWLADRDDGAEFRLLLPAGVIVEQPASPEEVPA
jgi:signal transduction histidine kinase